jgi:hypothetical protein
LREVRRPPDDQSSATRHGRRFLGDLADPCLHASPVHGNYAETVLPMKDGLPKFKDFPAEFGGSGEAMAE